jgi:hypothetical protein
MAVALRRVRDRSHIGLDSIKHKKVESIHKTIILSKLFFHIYAKVDVWHANLYGLVYKGCQKILDTPEIVLVSTGTVNPAGTQSI